MSEPREPFTVKGYLKKLLRYFFQGLVVLAPIGITIWVVFGLFAFIDGILPNIVHVFAPSLLETDVTGNPTRIPGLGFVIVVVVVLFVGWISSLFFINRIVSFLDHILEKTPGIKFIYSSVKDFLEAFAGNKRKFDRPVLVNVDATDVWRIGFITQKDAHGFGLPDHVTVYVPHSYAISGITYIVPKERIRYLPNITPSDAMKYTISGGVTEVHE